MQSRLTRRLGMAASLGGLVLLGGVTLAAPAAAPQVLLHPNHVTAKPPHNGGGGGTPPALGWASSNWSGYAATTAAPYHAITANWTVPSVSRTRQASYSAAWAGIDGFNNSSLIQTGTEEDYYSGSAHYGAWWTTSAQGFLEQTIAEPVTAGDPMTATITQVSGTSWSLTLADAASAHPWSFTKALTYSGPGASAEWIMEAPTVGGRVAPMANYSTFAFDPGTVNGGSPNLVASEGGELVQGRSVLSIPSAPDADQDGFASAYGSVAPAPPKS